MLRSDDCQFLPKYSQYYCLFQNKLHIIVNRSTENLKGRYTRMFCPRLTNVQSYNKNCFASDRTTYGDS